jgi:hypothetical protein
MMMYIVATELNVEEIINPIIFARQEVVKRIIQKLNVRSLISSIQLATNTKERDCIPDRTNR